MSTHISYDQGGSHSRPPRRLRGEASGQGCADVLGKRGGHVHRASSRLEWQWMSTATSRQTRSAPRWRGSGSGSGETS